MSIETLSTDLITLIPFLYIYLTKQSKKKQGKKPPYDRYWKNGEEVIF